MEFRFCKPCDKHFKGTCQYWEHMDSEKHERKMREQEAASAPVMSPRSTLVQRSQSSDLYIRPHGKGFWCNLCNLELNEPDQVKTHVTGRAHLKLKSYHPACSIWNMYSVFNLSFHDMHIENVLEGAKVFDVNDPIEF